MTFFTTEGSRWEPAPPHDEAACFALHRELFNVSSVARFTVDGEPVSKARARFTRSGRAYTPEKTRAAEERTAWAFRQATRGHRIDPEVTYGVMCIFFHGTNQRRDVDNMVKMVCDALTGVAWQDDSQVTEISARRGFDAKENARTEVWVYEVGRKESAIGTCASCGNTFKTYASWANTRKHCSKTCADAARRKPLKARCEGCGAEFIRPKPSSKQRFCSRACSYGAKRVTLGCVMCGATYTYPRSLAPKQIATCSQECKAAYWRKQRKTAARGTCESCGGPTSKRTYQRCQACRDARGSADPKRSATSRKTNLTTTKESQDDH